MKKLFLAAFAALSLGACSYASRDAGQEAVLVAKPWFFGHGGVADEPVKTGTKLIALSTDVVYVDVKPVEWEVKFDDLMSRDGVPLHFDATIVVQVADSVDLIKRFGPKWFENNLDSVFRNRVRQAVRKHGMNEVAIDTVAIDAIDHEVNQAMVDYVKKAKIPIRIVRLTVGKANPPDAIKDQRVETAQQEQRQKTEAMKYEAEVARKKAELARAEADNAYRSQMSLSPEQFVDLQRIGMQEKVCTTGKGCTFIIGNGAALVGGR